MVFVVFAYDAYKLSQLHYITLLAISLMIDHHAT